MYNLSKLNKLLERQPNTHKGQSGNVLIIAGSSDLAGAAILASVTALRVAADLVTLTAPREVCVAAQSYCPDLVTKKLPGKYLKQSHYNKIIQNISRYNIILIGSGIGLNNETKKLIIKLLKHKNIQKIPKVIDADAIKIIKIQIIKNAILTPHKKEFEILMQNSKIKTKKQLLHSINDNVIILKGKEDKIITATKTYTNKTGNPGMAKAGTGDVLAGLCAGILAKTQNLQESAIASAWLSGYLGDILKKKKKGYFYIASDLIKEIKNIKKI